MFSAVKSMTRTRLPPIDEVEEDGDEGCEVDRSSHSVNNTAGLALKTFPSKPKTSACSGQERSSGKVSCVGTAQDGSQGKPNTVKLSPTRSADKRSMFPDFFPPDTIIHCHSNTLPEIDQDQKAKMMAAELGRAKGGGEAKTGDTGVESWLQFFGSGT